MSVTEQDILDKVSLPDSVGIDSNRQNPKGPRHSPDGKEGSLEDIENRELFASLFTYENPYRCLVPQEIEGLVVAGRAISANHEADGYTRNQPACMVTGQAAGAAAAIAAKSGERLRDLDVKYIQSKLREQGAKLPCNELLMPQQQTFEALCPQDHKTDRVVGALLTLSGRSECLLLGGTLRPTRIFLRGTQVGLQHASLPGSGTFSNCPSWPVQADRNLCAPTC